MLKIIKLCFWTAVGTVLLPLNFKIPIIPDTLVFKSWNLFLLFSALAALISFFVCVFVITETPKFLLMKNRKEESLQILQEIYSTNTKQPKDTYPVSATNWWVFLFLKFIISTILLMTTNYMWSLIHIYLPFSLLLKNRLTCP